jgi:2-oxoglutarate dehydrogenase E1 component
MGAIYAYRNYGHTQCTLDPLNPVSTPNECLTLDYLGFKESDLDEVYFTFNYQGGKHLPLRQILDSLKETYCGNFGIEFQHIQDTKKRRWLAEKMESISNKPEIADEKKKRILKLIAEAETFENFLHTRFVGQKRFSMEGAESGMAFLEEVADHGATLGLQQMMIGMAHRGRLNILVNFVGKDPRKLFLKFSDKYTCNASFGEGDVKYHLGHEGEHPTSVLVGLAANPSHLEAADPVVEGIVRSRQEKLGDTQKRSKAVPVLIHGDAAVIGQGVVAEVMNYARLPGYTTGGTIHVVFNNQVGFTTDPCCARSARYCTEIAKIIDIPIIHVNGDDPLAVTWAARLAIEYRQQFGEDVMVDIICYRRYGHNEGDEPAFTQPTMYRTIAQHPRVSEHLAKRLIAEGVIKEGVLEQIKAGYETQLNQALEDVRKYEATLKPGEENKEPDFMHAPAIQPAFSFAPVTTTITQSQISKLEKVLTNIPADFNLNPKIDRQLKAKKVMFETGEGFDWGTAEALAFGSLLDDGTSIRLSGEDVQRGTFSHRHCVLHDAETNAEYVQLNNIDPKQAKFTVYNSPLSEEGILGFEYGYSIDNPEKLILWEAQFGDFANGAQIIIDQFIVSGETKWQNVSGMVMLLPHGYEGQGPEHSSARLERYLQLCAQDNIQVCNVTTPVQYFHLLRRQMKRNCRKPLILMTPKSLLRHKDCVSKLNDFISGSFEEMLDDPEPVKDADRLILCSGKVFYDLLQYRRDNPQFKANIVRIEQFYPFNSKKLRGLIEKYTGFKKLIWCQEEPQNQGGWSFISPLIEGATDGLRAQYIGRIASPSTAVGLLPRHRLEQARIMHDAFNA